MNRVAIAYHEAGHEVVAWYFHFKPRFATITRDGEYAGRAFTQNPLRGIRLDVDGSDRARLRAEKCIQICLAGAAAQRRFKPRSWRAYHGSFDFERAVQTSQRLCCSGQSASAYLAWLELETNGLVEILWDEVRRVADALLEKNSLSGYEIVKLIRNA